MAIPCVSTALPVLGLCAFLGCGEGPTEPPRNVTPEGVVLTVATSAPAITRGDTAVITVSLANPLDTAVTIPFTTECQVLFSILNSRGESMTGGYFHCPGPPAPLTIPPRAAHERTVYFTGEELRVNNPVPFIYPADTYYALAALGLREGTDAPVFSRVAITLYDP